MANEKDTSSENILSVAVKIAAVQTAVFAAFSIFAARGDARKKFTDEFTRCMKDPTAWLTAATVSLPLTAIEISERSKSRDNQRQ